MTKMVIKDYLLNLTQDYDHIDKDWYFFVVGARGLRISVGTNFGVSTNISQPRSLRHELTPKHPRNVP